MKEKIKSEIQSKINAIHELLAWEHNVPEAKREGWHKRFIDIERQLKEMDYAISENPSVAAYGESQMGKSYLIAAMLGQVDDEGESSFCMSDGHTSYSFIDKINPSLPGSQNEATGIVTRFKRYKENDIKPTSKEWLQVRLLSIADIVLILAEAWCTETVRATTEDANDYFRAVDDCIKSIPNLPSPVEPLIPEVDLAYIEKYLKEASSSSNFGNIVSSNLFYHIRRMCLHISQADTVRLLRFVWNNNPDYNRLFDDLVAHRKTLGTDCDMVEVEFKSVLKCSGTILDVERLNEMYRAVPSENKGYIGNVRVLRGSRGEMTVSKPFLSALTAELIVDVDSAGKIKEREFLNDLDILDFPGLKGSQEITVASLGVGDNLATVFRRGKVTYLFAKYSATRRICSLLFCQNHNDYNAGKLGGVLERWVNTNIGATPDERASVYSRLTDDPLLIVSTWFNCNLEYNATADENVLNELWNRRFVRVLTGQVVKATNMPDHWFNSWSRTGSPFRSIFLLRSFKYSHSIFEVDKDEVTKEDGTKEKVGKAYHQPYLDRLRTTFLSNNFVSERFGDRAASQWHDAATPGNDGTRPIIDRLTDIAPNAKEMREEKFARELDYIRRSMLSIIDEEHHKDDPSEETRKGKKTSGDIALSIASRQGGNPWFFSKFLTALAIPEQIVREEVHRCLNGAAIATTPTSDAESEIIMSAGITANDSREVKLQKLMDLLGADDEAECRDQLKEYGVKIENILGKQQMLRSPHEELTLKLEQLWLRDYLGGTVASSLRHSFPQIDTIVGTIEQLWYALGGHQQLSDEIGHLTKRIIAGRQVGIVANWAQMQMVRFTNEFGYSWIDKNMLELVRKKNEEFKLGIDFSIGGQWHVECGDSPCGGVEMLKQIDEVKSALSTREHNGDGRQLPEYRERWRWLARMRMAFAIVSGLRKYDIDTNNRLGKIREKVLTT